MRFSEQLRQESDTIFEAIYEHPYVKGIADGSLNKQQLIHYVKQDFEYLNVFMRIYGLTISKCRKREDIALFNEQIDFVLNSEVHPHNNFCEVAGVNYEDLQGDSLAPAAQHYTRHMLTVAHSGNLAEIIAVLLPCPWTYAEIGRRLMEDIKPEPSHPFYDWITFYGGKEGFGVTDTFCARLDELTEHASTEEKERMIEHFKISCELEYMFWDMAYTIQEWPITGEKVFIE